VVGLVGAGKWFDRLKAHLSLLIKELGGPRTEQSRKVVIGSSKSRAHASHHVGCTQQIEGKLVAGIASIVIGQSPHVSFLRHLKDTAQQLLCRLLQDLAE
jgi:hypothetical protein